MSPAGLRDGAAISCWKAVAFCLDHKAAGLEQGIHFRVSLSLAVGAAFSKSLRIENHKLDSDLCILVTNMLVFFFPKERKVVVWRGGWRLEWHFYWKYFKFIKTECDPVLGSQITYWLKMTSGLSLPQFWPLHNMTDIHFPSFCLIGMVTSYSSIFIFILSVDHCSSLLAHRSGALLSDFCGF